MVECRLPRRIVGAVMLVSMTQNTTMAANDSPCGVVAAATYLGISPSTMRRLALSGEVSHLRVGRRRLIKFRPQDLAAYERKVAVPAIEL